MNSKTNCCKSAKWALVALVVSGAALARGSDGGAALSANGVVVGGKVCRETERRDFADGWAVRYVLPKGNYELLGFVDADDRLDGYRIDRRAVGRDGKIDLALRPCGGYCARIVRVE